MATGKKKIDEDAEARINLAYAVEASKRNPELRKTASEAEWKRREALLKGSAKKTNKKTTKK